MKNLKLSVAIAAALFSGSTMADSWNLTQTATPGSDTTMSQEGGTSTSSVQAMNVINAATGTTIDDSSSQTAAMTTFDATLNQTDTTAASTQAVNYAKAGVLGATGGDFVQSHTGTGDITLVQDATGTGGNTQAVNAVSAAVVTDLKQSVETSTNVTLNQTTTGTASSTQAVNTVSGTTTMTNVVQDIATVTTLDMNQSGAASNIQAGNNAVAGTEAAPAAMGTVDQTTTSATVTMDQNGGATGTQAANRAVAASVTKLTQSLTSSNTAVTLKQGDTTASGNGATQAGNMLVASGAVTEISQTTGDSGDTVTLNQGGAGTGLLQAANLIDASASGAQISSANVTDDQIVLANLLDMDQTANTSIQAGNAVITGGGDGVLKQGITVTTLEMTQAGTSGSIQAANYAGAKL